MPHASIVRDERDRRQKIAMVWAIKAFGQGDAKDRRIRALRFLEEAIELVQTQGLDEQDVMTVARYVMGRPVGQTTQEIGGVMTALNVLAENLGLSIDDAEFTELSRVLGLPVEKLRKKQEQKAKAGLV